MCYKIILLFFFKYTKCWFLCCILYEWKFYTEKSLGCVIVSCREAIQKKVESMTNLNLENNFPEQYILAR